MGTTRRGRTFLTFWETVDLPSDPQTADTFCRRVNSNEAFWIFLCRRLSKRGPWVVSEERLGNQIWEPYKYARETDASFESASLHAPTA